MVTATHIQTCGQYQWPQLYPSGDENGLSHTAVWLRFKVFGFCDQNHWGFLS